MHPSIKCCFSTIFKMLCLFCLLSTSLLAQEGEAALKKLSLEAEAIVIGKVIDSKSEWTKDKSKIVTNVTISVEEYLKGSNKQKNIIVSHLGGEVDGVGELYSHTASFTNDEEVLVFVQKDSEEKLTVLGGSDGKLLIKDAAGEKLVGANKPLKGITAQIKKFIETKE